MGIELSTSRHDGVRRAFGRLPGALFWLGVALCAAGFVGSALWRQVADAPELTLIALALVAYLPAWGLARVLRWPLATSLTLVWSIALVLCAGVTASLATGLMALAALAVGSIVVGPQLPARAALSTVAGLALMAGVAGWSLPLPVPYLRWVYVAVLLALIAWRRQAVMDLLRPLPGQWRDAMAVSPRAAAAAVTLMGVVSTSAWLPTVMYDDLVYHLGLPLQLAERGYYPMNAASNVWAVSAWAGDVVQAVARVVAGGGARGPVDMLWLILSAVLLWQLCKVLALSGHRRWLAVALFVSTPLVAALVLSMQTEGPTTTVVLALALVLQQRSVADRRAWLLLGALFGVLVGLKVSNAWFGLPLGIWLVCQRRWWRHWRTGFWAALLALAVAGSSYAYAWVLTGNPVLPVFNNLFHSPYFPPAAFADPRWHHGFGWTIVWQLVFHTPHYFEGQSGALGLVPVALAGCFFVAWWRAPSRALATVALVAFLLPLAVIQYARYALPGMVLLMPVMLCGLPRTVTGAWSQRGQRVVLWGLVAVGGLLLTTGAWQLKTKALQRWIGHGETGVLQKYAPIRLMARYVRVHVGPTARTLVTSSRQPFAAVFAGRGFSNSWYDPHVMALLQQPGAGQQAAPWLQAIAFTGADTVVAPDQALPPGLRKALAQEHAERVHAVGGLALWQLHAGQPGVVTTLGAASRVRFDMADAPTGPTLIHGQLLLACAAPPAGTTVTVDWTWRDARGQVHRQRRQAICHDRHPLSVAFDAQSSARVTAFAATVTGAQVSSARACFRVDRTALDDLAVRLRHGGARW